MSPHENLDLWKKAIEFVVAVYKVTEGFPKDEKFGLTSQLRAPLYRSWPMLLKEQGEDLQRSSGNFCLTHKVRLVRWIRN